MLLNAAKYKGYSFYCLSVIKWEPTEGRVKGKITLTHPD